MYFCPFKRNQLVNGAIESKNIYTNHTANYLIDASRRGYVSASKKRDDCP